MYRARLLLAALVVVDILSLLVIVILPVNSYEWMRDLDPEMESLPLDDLQGFWLFLSASAVAAAGVVHVAAWRFLRAGGQRIWCAAVPPLLLLCWAWKFLLAG